jgi:hypothetical protein
MAEIPRLDKGGVAPRVTVRLAEGIQVLSVGELAETVRQALLRDLEKDDG